MVISIKKAGTIRPDFRSKSTPGSAQITNISAKIVTLYNWGCNATKVTAQPLTALYEQFKPDIVSFYFSLFEAGYILT